MRRVRNVLLTILFRMCLTIALCTDSHRHARCAHTASLVFGERNWTFLAVDGMFWASSCNQMALVHQQGNGAFNCFVLLEGETHNTVFCHLKVLTNLAFPYVRNWWVHAWTPTLSCTARNERIMHRLLRELITSWLAYLSSQLVFFFFLLWKSWWLVT